MPGEILKNEARHRWSGLFLSRLRQLATESLDLVFPPRCIGCGRIDAAWCNQCQYELVSTPLAPYYRRLSKNLKVASTGVHEGKLQQAVQGLKYENLELLAPPLADRMFRVVSESNSTFDMIIPVPLHMTRRSERGYNQAQILAEHLAKQLLIPCNAQAVQRIRNTRSQVGLTRKERLQNVADAFETNSALVMEKSILLVDDVCTTGATIHACAVSLSRSGAAFVFGLTVTSAQPDDTV